MFSNSLYFFYLFQFNMISFGVINQCHLSLSHWSVSHPFISKSSLMLNSTAGNNSNSSSMSKGNINCNSLCFLCFLCRESFQRYLQCLLPLRTIARDSSVTLQVCGLKTSRNPRLQVCLRELQNYAGSHDDVYAVSV